MSVIETISKALSNYMGFNTEYPLAGQPHHSQWDYIGKIALKALADMPLDQKALDIALQETDDGEQNITNVIKLYLQTLAAESE